MFWRTSCRWKWEILSPKASMMLYVLAGFSAALISRNYWSGKLLSLVILCMGCRCVIIILQHFTVCLKISFIARSLLPYYRQHLNGVLSEDYQNYSGLCACCSCVQSCAHSYEQFFCLNWGQLIWICCFCVYFLTRSIQYVSWSVLCFIRGRCEFGLQY